ncbi:transglutaminase-like domain-containing protein [Teichococcus vastitatis]|uniref:Transglutaminase family protein n=1 Tax=Teichococcus vastitatis TaxID=2307076 RepID=A0ABS9W955_9PROT|nr:transglutaminase family protein [Pseudoroseomonas vastitatis]MCI0755832.1 transglutaminase family protein [Pseudoroseomonas vastitatis]
MLIKAGFEIIYDCPQPTPMLLVLSPHASRLPDLVAPQRIDFAPFVPSRTYHDGFGNFCTRVVAPSGRVVISSDFTIQYTGMPDPVVPGAVRHPVEDLPDEMLIYLLASRYCDTERLSETAWSQFGHLKPDWGLVQAICDFTHRHITFGYEHARATRTASEAFTERHGVCRDYAHLAITLCRCLNIPARYCTGYLSDIGVPPPHGPMDFAAWFEVWLGGGWHTFDARNNTPRIGRILMARGRDATDVAIATTFGPCTLSDFRVMTDEVAST